MRRASALRNRAMGPRESPDRTTRMIGAALSGDDIGATSALLPHTSRRAGTPIGELCWSAARSIGRLLLATIALLAAVQTVAAEAPRLLLLHSFGPHYPPWNTVTAKFREELRKQSPDAVDLYEASLQDGRTTGAGEERPFVDYLNALFAGRDLALVVAVGAPAARFFLRNRPALFPSVPLIIAAADVRAFSEETLTANDTTVSVTFDQALQVENILQVLPGTTDIAVAVGDSPLERFWMAELRRSFERFSSRVNFHWLNELSFGEMIQRVRELPPRTAIYYATVRVDGLGEPQEEDRVFMRFR